MNSTQPTTGRGRPRLYETPEQATEARAARLAARQNDQAAQAKIKEADAVAAGQPPVEVLLLTLEQAARMLQVSTRTVFTLIDQGHLSSIKILGTRRVHSDELQRLARTGTATPTEMAS